MSAAFWTGPKCWKFPWELGIILGVIKFTFDSHDLWKYRALVTRVVDGDTIDVIVDRGFNQYGCERLRILGVDTPELNSKDPGEREKAKAAKARVEQLCLNREVLILSEKGDSFGRWLAEVFIPNDKPDPVNPMVSLGQRLIEEGHGVIYFR